MINIIFDVILPISTSSMAYERILDSIRVYILWYVACSYLTYVNLKVSGKTDTGMQQLILRRAWNVLHVHSSPP